jgi:prepilin-type N-terminal cleavage/methylation domain-containing protein
MGEIYSLPIFMRHRSAFTLVELIVVITILAILATIAFFSFSGYSANARDSTRLSDLTNLAKSLEITLSKAWSLPQPGTPVTLKASGWTTTIWYQWFADSRILSYLWMSEAKDALDGVYYTYASDANLTKYQVLWFLESADTLTLNTNIAQSAYADANDYSKRYPVTKGKTLGIILKSDTKVPIQQIPTPPTTLDTSSGTTSSGYTVQLTNTDVVTMSWGSTLISPMAVYQPKTLSSLDSSLVGYWDMETMSGWKLYDLSGHGNDGAMVSTWTYVPQFLTSGNGKKIQLSGNGDYINLWGTWTNLIDEFTISWVFTINNFPQSGAIWDIIGRRSFCAKSFTDFPVVVSVDSAGRVSFMISKWDDFSWDVWLYFNSAQTWVTYNFQAVYKKNDYAQFYVNWISIGKVSINFQISSNSQPWVIWRASEEYGAACWIWKSGLSGSIDNYRIYNRALSDSEIQTLYNATK